MTLLELRRGALLRYGLNPYEGEDPVLLRPLMTDLVNEAHRWAAGEARLYRRTFTANLGAASGGFSTVTLDETVNLVDTGSGAVAWLNGTEWQDLDLSSREELTALYGPLENADAADPHSYYLDTGYTDSAQRTLVVYPGPSAQITNGFKYPAWVYPADMTAESDRPEFPSSEHDLLLPMICWKMAQALQSANREAPVGMWQGAAAQALLELRSRQEAHRRGSDLRRIRMVEEDYY